MPLVLNANSYFVTLRRSISLTPLRISGSMEVDMPQRLMLVNISVLLGEVVG